MVLKNIIISEVESYLSNEFGKNVQVSSTESIGGGCVSQALKLETNIGAYFMKSNSDCAPDLFLREAEGLKELAKACGEFLVIPKVIVATEADETPGFILMEYLPPSGDCKNMDEALGLGLAALHKYQNQEFGFYANNYCGATSQNNTWQKHWNTFFTENRLRYLLNLIQNERGLLYDDKKQFDKLLLRVPELLTEKSTPVLIHGDLWSGNYMYTKQGPALIDPAAYYADREMEFAIITMFGGFTKRFFDAYNASNPLPSNWKERNLLYQLYHVLNHYYLFGGGYILQARSIAKRFL